MWSLIKDNFWQLLIVLNYVLAIGAAVTILLKNVNPTKTLSYVLILLVFPYVGLIVYFLFGQEYRKSKIFKRKNILNQKNIQKWHQSLMLNKRELEKIEKDFLKEKFKLVKLVHNSERSPLTLHNEVDILINGEEKFKRLFEDIKTAQHSIHLEYYIIRDDEIGNQLIDALCERAAAGVEIKINYDFVASSLSAKARNCLTQNNIEFYPFMPVYFPRLASKLNYRNHRKIAIIDGKIGYVGGINVGDEYVNGEKKRFWRDTHLRLTGEAVGVLQVNFLLNWDFVCDHHVEKIEEDWFPENEITHETAVQIAASGPDTDWANIMEAYFLAITTAEKYVYITTPYFIPNDEIITALQASAKSGVQIKLIIPKNGDSWAAKYASFSYIEDLLRAGVEVYLYKKGVIHAKTMVIDDIFSTVGTSNLDYRSFNINFEINALLYDNKLANKMVNTFNNDLQECERVDPNAWYERKMIQKLKESFCRLWAPLL
ncbi:cardiolipin synthase [Robertkochia solimangrovi]|uniref:cardiolipin synthase n=1 Tax=Robertkochia solimangrovi TaxID=2213046 RepID=UPI00117C4562|nr:cardiolipin synthase [Robertkochia solimangrovi]TRZ43673.1 cardiolipin synthase [Robertkochia solimangrovi]